MIHRVYHTTIVAKLLSCFAVVRSGDGSYFARYIFLQKASSNNIRTSQEYFTSFLELVETCNEIKRAVPLDLAKFRQ